MCLAAFNGIRWVAEQLDSILVQVGVDLTVFVSVDQSSDGTEEWFERRASGDPRIVVLPRGQRFGGAARNFFRLLRDVDFARYDYVSFSDQDDIWHDGKLRRAHDLIEKTGSDGYSGNVIAFWASGRRRLIRKSQPQRKWDFLFEAAGPGCTYVIKAEVARRLQAMLRERRADVDAVMLHDWLIYAFARANGYRWIIDEEPWMSYRQHTGNQVGINRGWAALQRRVQTVLFEGGAEQPALIAQLVGLEDEPFVRRFLSGNAIGLMRLAGHARDCRRRVCDQIIFGLACLSLATARARTR